ncbi:double-CXXCG motif protein [Myxococcus sp. RHSTA-1-4]|uniref:SitI6 family double-CXXCG motif immunity protein n=1 Tax=Myxococcus sp. RHSTA-1-4 TaxID=2874601 RepID=UPI001CBAF7B9|nr:double-CXXCG motif protein [Myxococcus sp. RHSTA-1-4]MBZ4417860.1 double-CXXCG motif protein [Myxococcus sp. RHSTA-1-4]
MTRYFWLREDETATARFSGSFDAAHAWGLPGVQCPGCGATWSSWGHHYPNVDLSQLPERREFENPRPEPFPVFARLRECVRPLAPPNVELPPGTALGPLEGRASGEFGPFTWQGTSLLLVRRDALERLQAAGVQGLLGCRTELRFRQKNPPALLDLQIEPRGRLHPDCIPPDVPPPCAICGRHAFSRPDEPILDAASLPGGLDLFRVGNFATMIIGTARLRDAVHSLELPGIAFRELLAR